MEIFVPRFNADFHNVDRHIAEFRNLANRQIVEKAIGQLCIIVLTPHDSPP
jgi:hypothetical protein